MKTKENHRILSFCVALLCAIFSNAQAFNVTEVPGHEYSYKPSLSQRLNGIKEVIVFAPKIMSEYDKYIYPCLANYFRGLGMQVSTKYVKYKLNRDSQPYLETVWKTLDESLEDYWDNSNTLLVVANNVSSFGKATGHVENTLQIYLIDPISDFVWTVRFDLPNKSDKFDKKLRNTITSAYNYNPAASHSPSYYTTGWSEPVFKSFFNSNNYHPLEGVYEGDNYKIGVKRDENGKFYLVYLSGATNSNDWSAGDVKAILEPTATPTVFKAKWYGKWKQKMNFTVIFKEGLMTTYDEDRNQEAYIKLYPAQVSQSASESAEWSGTGFALKNGYVVTNYHVIDGAKSITVQGVKGNFNTSYNATLVGSDKNNDLALLKISDSSFNGFGTIPYSISPSISEVGEDIFVLGYPLTSTMGDEIKLTTGVISSKTGFQGDVALYQISAPIQPGNSGGPLFDKKGNVIGVVSAKHAGAENVGYAIKSMYLHNLIESCASSSIIPTTNSVSTLPLTGKVKAEKNFVFFIHCSSTSNSNAVSYAAPNVEANSTPPNSTRIIKSPSYKSKGDGNLSINSITLTPTSTILDCSYTNPLYQGWMNISRDAYLQVNGIKYKLTNVEGIAYAPSVTSFAYPNQTLNFKLYFPAIPSTSTILDFIESPNSEWKILGLSLK